VLKGLLLLGTKKYFKGARLAGIQIYATLSKTMVAFKIINTKGTSQDHNINFCTEIIKYYVPFNYLI